MVGLQWEQESCVIPFYHRGFPLRPSAWGSPLILQLGHGKFFGFSLLDVGDVREVRGKTSRSTGLGGVTARLVLQE